MSLLLTWGPGEWKEGIVLPLTLYPQDGDPHRSSPYSAQGEASSSERQDPWV